jgi:hypothetical protein
MVKSPPKRGKGALSGGKGGKQNRHKQTINEYSDDDGSDDDEHGGADENLDITKLSRQELIGKLRTAQANIKLKTKEIKTLEVRLKKATTQQKGTKKQVRMDFQWNGEESIFADTVTQFCKTYLFPRFKFLKHGWNDFNRNRGSLSSLVNRHIKVPEGADYEDQWERVIVPTIRLKYINMKCNLNNDIRATYKSKYDDIIDYAFHSKLT